MFEREVETARNAARAAGAVIARHVAAGESGHWNKSEDNPVTRADLEANAAILEIISADFPDDTILSEETADSPERLGVSRLWIIDPLDGTKEFIARIPEFSVSIALVEDGTPVAGCVFQPLTDECHWAARNGGAFLDGTRLAISSVTDLRDATMLSSRTEMKRGQVDAYADWFREVTPIGSVALKLAYVAVAARGDLWISTQPKSEWDVCAGDLLVREAGGRFVTLHGGERTYNQADVLLQPLMVAGPAKLVDEFCRRSEVL